VFVAGVSVNRFFKLGALGILCFIAVFLLILFSSGFFNRSLPQRGGDKNSLLLNPASVKEQNFIIGNSSFITETPARIVVRRDEGLAITVSNGDSAVHRVLELYKKDGEFKVFKEFFVGPKEKVVLIGFFNLPTTTSGQMPKLVFVGGLPLLPPHSQFDANEYLISCTTCTGEKSQVKIVLEK